MLGAGGLGVALGSIGAPACGVARRLARALGHAQAALCRAARSGFCGAPGAGVA